MVHVVNVDFLSNFNFALFVFVCQVGSLIRKKTQRLLNAKHELMR